MSAGLSRWQLCLGEPAEAAVTAPRWFSRMVSLESGRTVLTGYRGPAAGLPRPLERLAVFTASRERDILRINREIDHADRGDASWPAPPLLSLSPHLVGIGRRSRP